MVSWLRVPWSIENYVWFENYLSLFIFLKNVYLELQSLFIVNLQVQITEKLWKWGNGFEKKTAFISAYSF